MSRALQIARAADREQTAGRLLRSSAGKFYDPEVDIDWDAPLAEDKIFQPEHRCSLYGTHLWERLSPEQRVELGKHEVASIASVGLWFEMVLMQALLKEAYRCDPTSRHAQYALTEIADECRHSVMFARAIERLAVPAYGPPPKLRQLARLFSTVTWGPAMYGAILVAEETLDRMQREAMADERVQPLVRMVNRIHVLEEARHVTFARQEVARGMASMSRAELLYQRGMIAYISYLVIRSMINPRAYLAVGLDPREARRVALGNRHYQQTVRWSGERIMAFLQEVGLVGAPGMRWWRESFLLPVDAEPATAAA